MNKTLGSTLITSGTMIGAGMLAMPLTSAGIGFTFTVVLLVLLWILLTYSALLFVEVYQTAEHDAGIGTLAAQYFGRPGRIVATSVLMIFLYALLSAYVTGGGAILASTLPDFATPDLKMKGSILAFTIFFGIFVAIGTSFVDALNRFLFIAMIAVWFPFLRKIFPLCFRKILTLPRGKLWQRMKALRKQRVLNAVSLLTVKLTRWILLRALRGITCVIPIHTTRKNLLIPLRLTAGCPSISTSVALNMQFCIYCIRVSSPRFCAI